MGDEFWFCKGVAKIIIKQLLEGFFTLLRAAIERPVKRSRGELAERDKYYTKCHAELVSAPHKQSVHHAG